ncbi:retrotransposon protein, putative, ty1-copia subclass [Tanacetum coccineum]|uniref:Retrotransposon protein, putative, ty1-copia subclass n=1 Tax=Tanacetum coccineum TaxID=301880 RepID=A0ABQ4ZJF2_9ASTR
MGYYFYFPSENKIFVARYAEFFEKNLITQEVSGRAINLEEIQDEDTSPSEITSEIPMEVEGFEPPQEEDIPIHRSERSLDRCCECENTIHDGQYGMGPIDFPPNCKTVGSKWIFKKKTYIDGIVHTYKARLIAKGYTQLYGVDYEEMFSPVADIRAIRILIAITAYYDYEIWQINVKTAFLNSYLDEDIYMVQPEASRSWNKRFDEEIKRFGFDQNLDEPCVYQKANGSNVTFLILYVDGIIIMGNHIPSLQSVKDYLGKCFAMKYLGEAAFILGIKIYRDRLDLNKTQGASTPKEVKRMQNVPYASVVGSIMYAVRCTRPDVTFAQNITSRFQQNPGKLHRTAMKNILKYLRNTKDMFLVYGGNPKAELRVDCYCNAGFETDIDDMKSLIGCLNYIAASEAEMEVVWIRKFISGLGIVPTINEPNKMFCDNSAALLIANEPRVQMGAKHYYRSNLLKVHTDDNLADPFMNDLSKGKLTQHARSMGLRLASSFI